MTFLQTVDKLGVGSYAQHHFSLIINSFFIFLKKAKNPAVFQPRFIISTNPKICPGTA